MAAEVIKVYREEAVAARFIGKRYTDEDRVGGMFGAKWGEWHQSGWFGELEKAGGDGGAYIGMCRCGVETGAGVFEYWIGILFPENADVPSGYAYVDLPASGTGVAWVRGRDDNGEIYGGEIGSEAYRRVETELNAVGKKIEGFDVSFERYVCPRFLDKDENGNVILDYVFYID